MILKSYHIHEGNWRPQLWRAIAARECEQLLIDIQLQLSYDLTKTEGGVPLFLYDYFPPFVSVRQALPSWCSIKHWRLHFRVNYSSCMRWFMHLQWW